MADSEFELRQSNDNITTYKAVSEETGTQVLKFVYKNGDPTHYMVLNKDDDVLIEFEENNDEFMLDSIETEEEQRRDEKRGLYPEHEDPAN